MSGIQEVARGSKLKPEQVRAVFDDIVARVARGEEVKVQGFGTFKRKMHKGRTLKSPLLDGGEVEYPDSYVLKFHQSPIAKTTLNVAAAKDPAGKKDKDGPKKTAEPAETPKAKAGSKAAKKAAKASKKAAPAPKKGKKAPPPPPPPEEDDDLDDEDDEDDE